MSSYLVVQLYCTPTEAGAIRSAAEGEISKFPEFVAASTELDQRAEDDYEMHREWATEHPGQDPAERAYFLLRVDSATDIPEPVLRAAETAITDWIDSTYNAAAEEITEVQWGSYAGTKLVN